MIAQATKPPKGGIFSGVTMQSDEMTVIKLSGPLISKFGREHRRLLDSGRISEVFNALTATVPGFQAEIQRLSRLGMRFAIFRNGQNVGEEDFNRGGAREVRIVPVLAGSKRAGILQTIVGAVLLVASIWFPALAPAGFALLAGGVMQMLSPQPPGLKQSASPDNQPSYAFGSARNTTASGNPVPICIGKRRWGGAIVSASIYAEDRA